MKPERTQNPEPRTQEENEMSEKYDAIIIGAGIIGCCIAFELSKRGHKTLNVDMLHGAGYGSTAGSCAIIRLHYSTPDGVAMAREGDETGVVTYIDTGCLVTKTERNKYLKHVMASLDDLDVEYYDLTPSEVKERYPFLDIRQFGPPKTADDEGFGEPTGDSIVGAVYIPDTGYISDPQQSVHNVQRAAEAKGAAFRFNSEVTDIRKEGERVAGITLKDGTCIDAPIVVNVAGPHSYVINQMAGVDKTMNIHTKALRQEVCHVPAPEGLDYAKAGMLLSDGDIGCYSRPEVGNHILIGSEDPDCDTLEWVDPDAFNRDFSDQWKTQAMREGQRVKGLRIPNQMQGVIDLYDCSDDWIPIYDKSDLSGFYMAVGTSGNQYKNAPVAGVLMAELIEKVEAGHDHDADPVQFTMKYTQRTCNIGFYSRLREINEDSSFSVIG
jgi:sarcosine oxidase subunit beta